MESIPVTQRKYGNRKAQEIPPAQHTRESASVALSAIAEQNNLLLTSEEQELLLRISEKLKQSDSKYEVVQVGEVIQSAEPQERKRAVEELVANVVTLIKTSPVIEFSCLGVGNVLGVPGARATGAKGYTYSYLTNKLEKDESLDDLDSIVDPDEDVPFRKRRHHYSKNGKLYLVCRIPFDSRPGNQFVSDTRTVHLTLVLRFIPSELLSLEDREIVEQFKKQGSDWMDFPEKILEECAREFIPEYYQNVKSLATERGEKIV